jgi:C4-dicarboxylate-specific signal transduction histidine kinase
MTLLIHKVLGLVRKEMALHRVKPVVAVSPDFSMVYGDDVQLQQLLLNLIMNAIDAIEMRGNGAGTLSITAYTEDGPAGLYHLRISDTGCGFDPAIREKLFEPFFSTKKDGLGLGLSISAAIVRGHNGTIRVENNSDGGTTFHIALPVAHEKVA